MLGEISFVEFNSTVKNNIGTDICEVCILLKSTDFHPRIGYLAGEIQKQISHRK